ncbi:ArnT family glycosyltransferase [Aquiflexum sp.]|uniref:ArnT family glycosyltransferase n=1 Tax=Aquiflexum sp. TaxID=1872584 RepID=UPI003592F93E
MRFHHLKNNLSLVLILVAFIVLIGPFALNFHLRYPDEMYYTNAAVKMVQTGDFQTTFLGDGNLRFKKPILTYWFVLVPFKLFGVSPLTSRLFFLLAGAISIALSYWAAMLFFKKKNIAILTACILSSLPIWILSSSRSIPDIVLGLFMTLSSVGFIGFLKYGNSTPTKYHWMLYSGSALAFAAKGLPAVALCFIGILYLLANPWQRIDFRRLIHFPSIIFSIVISCYWYLVMYNAYGAEFINAFFEDQVGARVTYNPSLILKNLLKGIISAILIFVPWILFGFFGRKKFLLGLKVHEKAFIGFVVAWGCCLIILSAFVVKFYSRYFIPVIPITSILLAWWLIKQDFLANSRRLQIGIDILLVVNFVILLVGMYLNFQLPSNPWIWVQLFSAIGGMVLIWLISRSVAEKLPLLFSLSIFLAVFLTSTVTYHLSLPDAGKSIKTFLKENKVPKKSDIAYLGNLHIGSKIRIGIGADYFMTDLQEVNTQDIQANFDYVILEDDFLEKFQNKHFSIRLAAVNWNPKYFKEMFVSLWYGNQKETKWSFGKKFYWAVPLKGQGNQKQKR